MSRGGKDKEERILSDLTQCWVAYSATKRELEVWKKFGNQLLDVVRCSKNGKLLWLNEIPNEVGEEHLVHLLNIMRSLVR